MAATPAAGSGSGGRTRRTVVRLAFVSAALLVVVVALAVLEVGVGLRWSSSNGAGGSFFSLAKGVRDDEEDGGRGGGSEGPRTIFGDAVGFGGGSGRDRSNFDRAYVVSKRLLRLGTCGPDHGRQRARSTGEVPKIFLRFKTTLAMFCFVCLR